ncbi:MAG: hypothetical protein ABRQ37_20820 [Candidatus Eremiobacterota bacterium]
MIAYKSIQELKDYLWKPVDKEKLLEKLEEIEDRLFNIEDKLTDKKMGEKIVDGILKVLDTTRCLLEKNQFLDREIWSHLSALIYLFNRLDKKVKFSSDKINTAISTNLAKNLPVYNQHEKFISNQSGFTFNKDSFPVTETPGKQPLTERDFKQPFNIVKDLRIIKDLRLHAEKSDRTQEVKEQITDNEFQDKSKVIFNIDIKSTAVPSQAGKEMNPLKADLLHSAGPAIDKITVMDRLIKAGSFFLSDSSTLIDLEDCLEETYQEILEIKEKEINTCADNEEENAFIETLDNILETISLMRDSIEEEEINKEIDYFLKELQSLNTGFIELYSNMDRKNEKTPERLTTGDDSVKSGNYKAIEDMIQKFLNKEIDPDIIDSFLEKMIKNAMKNRKSYENTYSGGNIPSADIQSIIEGNKKWEEGLNYLYDHYIDMDEDAINKALNMLYEANKKLLSAQLL